MNAAPAFPRLDNEAAPNDWGSLAKPDAETTVMTRDERIADGQEKFNALKTRTQEGLSKMMQGLKDRFYIGISRSAELPG